MLQVTDLTGRAKAAAIHLGICSLIAAMVATLVLGLWYPWPYSVISGGRYLLLVVLSVDLVLGPLLMFVIFNRAKTRSHLRRDIAVIAALQILGLGYGVYTVFLARPVAIVFEVDQFRVVSHVQVLQGELAQALPEFRALSLTGPKVLAARRPATSEERIKAIDYALQGFDVGARPLYWQPYGASVKSALERARPLSDLYKHYPQSTPDIDQAVARSGRNAAELKFLPLMARETDWSVLLNAQTGELVGFVPCDGYF